MIKAIRVMLIEDNADYRDIVKIALTEEPEMELCGQFATAEIAIRTLKDAPPEVLPDLILLDLRLPGMSGWEAISYFRQCVPQAKIIVLSQSDQESDVVQAITSGASGYLLKSTTLDELTSGIRNVINGGATLDVGVAKFILNALQTKHPSEESESLLSDRETQVLTLLAEGYVKKEIAKKLAIGYSTVDTHVGRIYQKLKVTNAPAAVNKAHRLNLFPTDDREQ